MKIIIDNINLMPDEPMANINLFLEKLLSGISAPLPAGNYIILKKSLDARQHNNIFYKYRIMIDLPPEYASILLEKKLASLFEEKPIEAHQNKIKGTHAIIIGSGPAGLFAALRLIEYGAKVTILERGKPVEERMKDIAILESDAVLNQESNVVFGEGGAGTYSDGKLTTRTTRPEISWFYKKLEEHGADKNILFEARPHIGTDRLISIIKNIRRTIIESGSEIFFGQRVDDLLITNGSIKGVLTSSGKEYLSDHVILATGHSARDVYKMLEAKKITLESKGFAVGTRIEHPSELINEIRYGKSKYRDILPPADYFLTHNNPATGTGTYSFCMCPGGSVINSSSEHGSLCVNGMSYSSRNSKYSNSAIVVTVAKENFTSPLQGLSFQQKIESLAFSSGNGRFAAPAQRATSFLKDLSDSDLPDSSYKNGTTPSMLGYFLPGQMVSEIKQALIQFDKKMKGFISDEAVLIGAETRTSSPVRITRSEKLESVTVSGLYPAGEGSGYSGGIVSSAVDGIRCADAIACIESRSN